MKNSATKKRTESVSPAAEDRERALFDPRIRILQVGDESLDVAGGEDPAEDLDDDRKGFGIGTSAEKLRHHVDQRAVPLDAVDLGDDELLDRRVADLGERLFEDVDGPPVVELGDADDGRDAQIEIGRQVDHLLQRWDKGVVQDVAGDADQVQSGLDWSRADRDVVDDQVQGFIAPFPDKILELQTEVDVLHLIGAVDQMANLLHDRNFRFNTVHIGSSAPLSD